MKLLITIAWRMSLLLPSHSVADFDFTDLDFSNLDFLYL